MKNESGKGLVKYIVIIAVLLAVVFLAQQMFFKKAGNSIFSKGSSAAQDYLTKGSNWVKDIVYPKISGEVEKRTDIIKDEVSQGKEKISESIGEKIKDYFSGVVDSVFNPGKKDAVDCQQCLQSCEPSQTSSGQ